MFGGFIARGFQNATPLPMFMDGTSKGLMTTKGGIAPCLNLTAPALVQAGVCRLNRITIIAPGSGSGGFTINDAASLGGAAASNAVWSLPYNAAANAERFVLVE
jgi:hypothetical protein